MPIYRFWSRLIVYLLSLIILKACSETIGLAESDFNNIDKKSAEDETKLEDKEGKFIPTKNWKTIDNEQEVPAGLHYRINLETGLKEAKLMDDTISQEDITKESNFLMNVEGNNKYKTERDKLKRQDIFEALQHIKSEDNMTPEEQSKKSKERKKLFRSYEDLKAEFKELDLNIESDFEILNRLILDFKSHSDDDLKVNILEDLEYLSHQIDNAIYFVDIGGIQSVIQPGLNSSNEEIRKGTMLLLGSASQSNPKVQIAAFEEGLLSQLLRIVSREKDTSISSKAVFAVSCLVRGFPFGQKKLLETGGLDTLREIFQKQDWKSLTVQLKVVSLIQDLLEEREEAEGERAYQLSKTNLLNYLVEGEWCPVVTSLLAAASFDKRGRRQDMGAALGKAVPLRPDHDMVDKIISTMVLLASSCQEVFVSDLFLLQSLEETYSDLAYKEQFQGEDGHSLFAEIALRIQQLVQKIKLKDEL